MNLQHPQEEDALGFEWPHPEAPSKSSFTLDEQYPGEALRLRMAGTMTSTRSR